MDTTCSKTSELSENNSKIIISLPNNLQKSIKKELPEKEMFNNNKVTHFLKIALIGHLNSKTNFEPNEKHSFGTMNESIFLQSINKMNKNFSQEYSKKLKNQDEEMQISLEKFRRVFQIIINYDFSIENNNSKKNCLIEVENVIREENLKEICLFKKIIEKYHSTDFKHDEKILFLFQNFLKFMKQEYEEYCSKNNQKRDKNFLNHFFPHDSLLQNLILNFK